MKRSTRHRRRQYVVNRPLQFRFVNAMVLIITLMAIGTVLSVFLALWLTLRTFGLHSDPVILPLFTTVGLTVMVLLVLIMPVVIVLGILLTHKVAGPLVRIQAALRQMAQGDYNIHLALRKGDDLIELADHINRLAQALRKRS